MLRTLNTLRLIAAGLALVLAAIGGSPAEAWTATGTSPNRVAVDGEPAAPDQCTAWLSGVGFGTIAVFWRDISDNEDGFTVEWWVKIKGKWVLEEARDVPASSNPTYFPLPSEPWNRYRVRAFNANGVSAWSNWARLNF